MIGYHKIIVTTKIIIMLQSYTNNPLQRENKPAFMSIYAT